MKLFYLIYISKAESAMSDAELLQLLDESRSRNELLGITGMMLYVRGQLHRNNEGRFMQVLEGTEKDVRALYDKIKADPRHYNVLVVNDGFIAKRNFKNWAMGFEAMDMDTYVNKPGYFDLNDDFVNVQKLSQFNIPLNFLKSFYMMGLGRTG